MGELEVARTRNGSSCRLNSTDRLSQIAGQQQQLEARRQEAANLGKQISQISEQLGSAREHRSGMLSRQKLLKDLESRREGVSEGVKSVLREREVKFPFIRGLVADVLRVDVEHAHVIEAALDGRDQWLVTESLVDTAAAREALDDLEGRVNILCADRLSSPSGSEALRPCFLEVDRPRARRRCPGGRFLRLEPASASHSLCR